MTERRDLERREQEEPEVAQDLAARTPEEQMAPDEEEPLRSSHGGVESVDKEGQG